MQESYHLGLKIRLESDSLEEDSDIKKVQERVVHSGMSAHHFDVGLAIQYNVTVWAITHEGYGKGTRETFLSYGDSKLISLVHILFLLTSGVSFNEKLISSKI